LHSITVVIDPSLISIPSVRDGFFAKSSHAACYFATKCSAVKFMASPVFYAHDKAGRSSTKDQIGCLAYISELAWSRFGMRASRGCRAII